MKLWAGRFTKETDDRVNTFNSSLSFDCRMYKHDIKGSMAHAKMLGKCGIIPMEDVDAILKGIGEQIYSMRVNIIDSFLSVILIIILLPKFGIYGYVLVIFITELLNTSLSIIRLLSKTGLKVEIRKWIVKPIISIILSTIITRLLFDFVFGGLSLYLKTEAIIKVVVCVTIYFVLINLFGAVSKSEYLLVKRAFAREPGG